MKSWTDKFVAWVMSALALMVVILLAASGFNCNPPEPAFETHVLLHQDLADIDQTRLDAFDLLVVGEAGFQALDPRHYDKTVLRLNPWATSQYKHDTPRIYWQPRPGDIGEPDFILEFEPGRGVHCFSWFGADSASHAERVVAWVDFAMGLGVRGVFMDDWGTRFQWAGSDSVKRKIWPHYPDDRWLAGQLTYIERRLTEVVARHRPDDGVLILNGGHRMFDTSRRFVEHWEIDRDWITDPTHKRFFREGDLINPNYADAAGELSLYDVAKFENVIDLAISQRGSVGLAHEEKPEQGGSVYQLIAGRWGAPENWPRWTDGE